MSDFFEPPQIDIEGDGKLYCRIETRMGSIEAELFEAEAPLTVANFVGLATGKTTGSPFYDGIIFHRVIPDFMIQAGCPQGRGTGGPGYRIRDEFAPGLKHDKPGLLSMANAGPNTGGSQFFITEVPTPWLDQRHAIFGSVTEGLDLITKITGVATDAQNRPREEISMEKVTIFRK